MLGKTGGHGGLPQMCPDGDPGREVEGLGSVLGCWREVGEEEVRAGFRGWGGGSPEGLGWVPAATSHLGVQLRQLLLIQVGLFVNSGLVPELRPGWGVGRDGDWASGSGEEAGPLSGLKVRVERAQPQLGGQRGAAPLL